MNNTKSWAVICPGASLNDHAFVISDPGGIVCINTALVWCLQKSITPDFWSMSDPEVFSMCSRKCDLDLISGKTVLSFPENFANHAGNRTNGWSDWLVNDYEIYDRFSKLIYEHDFEKYMHIGSDIKWAARTAFCGIAVAITGGADRVRLYGCDMAGSDYFEPGLKNWRANLTETRWNWERTYMNNIIEVCSQNNVEITLEKR